MYFRNQKTKNSYDFAMKLQLNFAEKANNKSIIVHKTKKNHNSLCIRKNTQRKKRRPIKTTILIIK